eukprot:s1291_g15.t1
MQEPTVVEALLQATTLSAPRPPISNLICGMRTLFEDGGSSEHQTSGNAPRRGQQSSTRLPAATSIPAVHGSVRRKLQSVEQGDAVHHRWPHHAATSSGGQRLPAPRCHRSQTSMPPE